MEAITKAKVMEGAREFGESLANCKESLAFKEAQKNLDKDEMAKELLSKYQLSLRFGRFSQNWGTKMSKDKSDELKNLEDGIKSNPIIQSLVDAQKNLQEMLVKINKEISDLLGIDFASNSRAGCC